MVDAQTIEARTERVIKEWHLYREGSLDHAMRRPWWGDQAWLRLSGADEEPLRFALSLASGPEHAVAVLGLGSVDEMLAGHNRLLAAGREVPRSLRVPVSVRLHGESWTFHGAGGRWLLGVVEARGSVALLGHDGERVLILLGNGEGFELCAALRLAEIPPTIDLDDVAARRPRAGARRPQPRRPRAREVGRRHHRSSPAEISPAIREHHRRILEGRPFGDDDRETINKVLGVALESIALSAGTVERPKTPSGRVRPRRAVACVRPILAVHRRMGVDHIGEGRAIFKAFKAFDPVAISMTAEEFVCALGLLVDTGTCLVRHPGRKRWVLRGEGIDDPHHPLHRELCKETGTGAGRRSAAGRPQYEGDAAPVTDEGSEEVGGPRSDGPVDPAQPFLIDLHGLSDGLSANDGGDPGGAAPTVAGVGLASEPVAEVSRSGSEGEPLVILVGRSVVREGLASEDEVVAYRDLVAQRASGGVASSASEGDSAGGRDLGSHDVADDRGDESDLETTAPEKRDHEVAQESNTATAPVSSALKILLEAASRPDGGPERRPQGSLARSVNMRSPPGTPPRTAWSYSRSWPA